MVPRFPWMRVCGVSSCTTVTSQLKLFIQHQVILSHSRGCWSLKCMACRWLYPIMSSKGKPYKYASWVALVPQYDLRAYGQHARHAFRAIGWLMGSLSVLDKSVKEGKERLERTDGLEVRGEGLGVASALISKFILHLLLTSSRSAKPSRMHERCSETALNEMQIMMSFLKTLLSCSLIKPSCSRNVWSLMCVRSAAHPEIITTSGSILSILLRDQDVTMRPRSQSLSVEEQNMA